MKLLPFFSEEESRPAIKLSMKTLKSKADEIKPVPSLKIKLPTKPKRSLLKILNGLTNSLPKPPEVPVILPKEDIIEDKTSKEILEEASREHVVKNVPLDEALDVVESELVVSVIMKDLVKKAVEDSKPKLKPITLKLNKLIKNKENKEDQPKFKVIRVSSTLTKKLKRPGSGLDSNDYKTGKKRKKRPKKLDKLIIRNVASLFKEPSPKDICSSLINNVITNLPCFEEPKPVTLKIRKDAIPSIQMKDLFKKHDNQNQQNQSFKDLNAGKNKSDKVKMLRKQLEIDMVGGTDLYVSNKRKASLEASKAFVVPTKRKPKVKEDLKQPVEEDPIDEELVENIFDQIMGDEDSSSTASSEDLTSGCKVTIKKSSSTPIAKQIGQLVKEEVAKEVNKERPSSPSVSNVQQSNVQDVQVTRPVGLRRSSSGRREMWITSPKPVVFARKSSAPPPPKEGDEIVVPMTEFKAKKTSLPVQDETSSESSESGASGTGGNIVKSTIKAIQLKANPEAIEDGSNEVLSMIDDLFDNFFENATKELDESADEPHQAR